MKTELEKQVAYGVATLPEKDSSHIALNDTQIKEHSTIVHEAQNKSSNGSTMESQIVASDEAEHHLTSPKLAMIVMIVLGLSLSVSLIALVQSSNPILCMLRL